MIAEAYEQFKLAMDAAHDAELSTKSVFCLCGREFPTGTVSRIAYGQVQCSDDRCSVCQTWQPVREAIQYLRDAQGRVHDADAWHSLKSAGEYLWLQQPEQL